VLSAENLRTGFVWRYFMRNQEIPRAMRLVGLDAREGVSVCPPYSDPMRRTFASSSVGQ
jgi:hypothetical protein